MPSSQYIKKIEYIIARRVSNTNKQSSELGQKNLPILIFLQTKIMPTKKVLY